MPHFESVSIFSHTCANHIATKSAVEQTSYVQIHAEQEKTQPSCPDKEHISSQHASVITGTCHSSGSPGP